MYGCVWGLIIFLLLLPQYSGMHYLKFETSGVVNTVMSVRKDEGYSSHSAPPRQKMVGC